MAKQSGSQANAPAKSSGKNAAQKAKKTRGSDQPSVHGDATVEDASSAAATGGTEGPPTTASELKALLKHSLSQTLHQDGVANTALNAASETPLLVRTDTSTPGTSPGKEMTNSGKKKKKTKAKTLKRTDDKGSHALGLQTSERSSVDRQRPPALDNDNNVGNQAEDGDSDSSFLSANRRLRTLPPRHTLCSFGSCCFSTESSTASAPWGPGRLLLALGTLRALPTDPCPLSRAAQAHVQALPSVAKTCWVELFIERSDELPFGVYSKPQVRVHLVDRFSGRATQPTQTTSPATLRFSRRTASSSPRCV